MRAQEVMFQRHRPNFSETGQSYSGRPLLAVFMITFGIARWLASGMRPHQVLLRKDPTLFFRCLCPTQRLIRQSRLPRDALRRGGHREQRPSSGLSISQWPCRFFTPLELRLDEYRSFFPVVIALPSRQLQWSVSREKQRSFARTRVARSSLRGAASRGCME